MDLCEAERIPICLVAQRDAPFKGCIQMYCSLTVVTKRSVRNYVLFVEESTGSEAWRLFHGRYAPDTQNRQYDLMEKKKT